MSLEKRHVKIKTFACTVVRKKQDTHQFLLVQETAAKAKTFYFPGGKIDRGEAFTVGALRETQEETGLLIQLDGLLRVEHNPEWYELRLLFAGSPVDDLSPLKTTADEHSTGAKWVTVEELEKYPMRDIELVPAYNACHAGAPIYSLLNFFLEEPGNCFGTERCRDPFELVVSIVLVSSNFSNLLCNEKGNYAHKIWLRDEQTFEAAAKILLGMYGDLRTQINFFLDRLRAQTGIEISLKGIISIFHRPLAGPEDSGIFEVQYVAVYGEAPLTKGCNWTEVPVSQVEEISAKVNNGAGLKPLNVIVNSIYNPW